MVAHTNAGALLELFFAEDNPGFPWGSPTWQRRTGIYSGLFPATDDQLPQEFSREDASAVHSFLDAWRAKSSVEDRHAFLQLRTPDSHTGRGLWKNFVSRRWRTWGIQKDIVASFEATNITPFQLMVSNKRRVVHKVTPVEDAYDVIAYKLFGADGLDDNGKAKMALRRPLKILAGNAAHNLRRATKSAVKRFHQHKSGIDALLDGKLLTLVVEGDPHSPPIQSWSIGILPTKISGI